MLPRTRRARPATPAAAAHSARRSSRSAPAAAIRRFRPRENASGTYAGKTTISGRGRPLLRVAAWRAVWAALRHNPVLAARHAHLTGRADNPLTDAQARIAVAGSLLRQLFVVVTTRTAWNPDIARGTLDPRIEVDAAAA